MSPEENLELWAAATAVAASSLAPGHEKSVMSRVDARRTQPATSALLKHCTPFSSACRCIAMTGHYLSCLCAERVPTLLLLQSFSVIEFLNRGRHSAPPHHHGFLQHVQEKIFELMSVSVAEGEKGTLLDQVQDRAIDIYDEREDSDWIRAAQLLRIDWN